MFNIVATGSKGNCVIYHNSIAIDCGVTFAKIKPFISDLQVVLLTHEHLDHINIKTLKKLQFERPSLRIGCGDWMIEKLEGLKNIDVYEVGELYDYGAFKISPIKLYHDVKNCGYRIFKGYHKAIHCTDTAHLNGIEAIGYNLYAIEHNYNEDTIHESIAKIEASGGFAYQKGAINTHLSEQKARDFIYKNAIGDHKIIRLHESTHS